MRQPGVLGEHSANEVDSKIFRASAVVTLSKNVDMVLARVRGDDAAVFAVSERVGGAAMQDELDRILDKAVASGLAEHFSDAYTGFAVPVVAQVHACVRRMTGL